MSSSNTVFVFTRNGMGEGPAELQSLLATKFFALVVESGEFPAKIVFYTEGVKLACNGSPVIESLKKLEKAGTELVLCKTCLDYFKLGDQVAVGVVGGMPDIIEAIQKADKTVSL